MAEFRREEEDKYAVVMPTRRISLSGFYRGQKVWVVHAIAKKYYVCARCYSGIGIGEDHAVMRGVDKDYKGRDHHHYCTPCVRNHVSPELELRRTLPSSETQQRALGKKLKRIRQNKRKNKKRRK